MNRIKKKKRILLFLLFAFSVQMAACGATRIHVSPLPTSAIVSGNTVSPENSLVLPALTVEENIQEKSQPDLLFFSAGETRKMSNYMLRNRFVHDGKNLFGSKHSDGGSPYFCKMKFSAGSKGMYIRDTEMIENNVDAEYLTILGDYVFFLRTDCETGKNAICKYPLNESAASGYQVLYNGTCDYLFSHGGRLWFTDADNHLLSMNTDGLDLRQIVSDKEIFFPFLLSDNLLLFQDDADGESLHLRILSSGEERKIMEGRVYEYVLSGTDLFCSVVAEETDEYTDMRARLCRIDLSGILTDGILSAEIPEPEISELYMGTRFAVNGDHINASNYRTVPLKEWESLSDDEYEAGYTAACQYVAENFEIFYDFNEEGFVNRSLFYEPGVKRAGYIEIG